MSVVEELEHAFQAFVRGIMNDVFEHLAAFMVGRINR